MLIENKMRNLNYHVMFEHILQSLPNIEIRPHPILNIYIYIYMHPKYKSNKNDQCALNINYFGLDFEVNT